MDFVFILLDIWSVLIHALSAGHFASANVEPESEVVLQLLGTRLLMDPYILSSSDWVSYGFFNVLHSGGPSENARTEFHSSSFRSWLQG